MFKDEKGSNLIDKEFLEKDENFEKFLEFINENEFNVVKIKELDGNIESYSNVELIIIGKREIELRPEDLDDSILADPKNIVNWEISLDNNLIRILFKRKNQDNIRQIDLKERNMEHKLRKHYPDKKA